MNQDDAEIRRLIEQRGREWDAHFRRMQDEIARKDELIEQARNRIEIDAYIQRRLAEERDEIAPELLDYIGGDSREAVERAIATAKAKTASILDGILQAQAMSAQVPSAPAPAGNPSPGAQQQQPQSQATADQIRAIEPGSPEHLVLRHRYGLDRGRGRGIFG